MSNLSLIWIAMRRLRSAMISGESSPFSPDELSDLLGFDLDYAYGLSGDAMLTLTSHLHAHNRYVIGLGLGLLAFESSDSTLADNAAQLMVAAAAEDPLLDGPDLTVMIQRLASLRRDIA